MFTTQNLDNLDHNSTYSTSTSAQTAFHGTVLSLTQHIIDEEDHKYSASSEQTITLEGCIKI